MSFERPDVQLKATGKCGEAQKVFGKKRTAREKCAVFEGQKIKLNLNKSLVVAPNGPKCQKVIWLALHVQARGSNAFGRSN